MLSILLLYIAVKGSGGLLADSYEPHPCIAASVKSHMLEMQLRSFHKNHALCECIEQAMVSFHADNRMQEGQPPSQRRLHSKQDLRCAEAGGY